MTHDLTLRIGHFGAGNIPQRHIGAVSETPDGVTIKGRFSTTIQTDLVTLRDQMLGLADQDRVPYPVTIEGAPHLDGWYYLTGIDLDLEPGALHHGWWPYSLTLERTPGSVVQEFESRVLSAGRLSGAPFYFPQYMGWQAIPGDAVGYEGPPGNTPVPTTRQTEDGPVRHYATRNSPYISAFARWKTPARGAMAGAARVLNGKATAVATTYLAPTGGGATSYVVPAGVTKVKAVASGASGGGSHGGRGATVGCDINVTPGETLTVVTGGVGKQRAGGYNGGGAGGQGEFVALGGYGGGGRTEIKRGSTRLVVAGGGGGHGAYSNGGYPRYGGAGGAVGSDGRSRVSESGRGGTRTEGGFGGDNYTSFPPGFDGFALSGGGGSSNTGPTGLGGGGGGGGVFGGGGGQAHLWYAPTEERQAGSGGGGSSMGTGIKERIVTGGNIGQGEVSFTPVVEAPEITRRIVTGTRASLSPLGWELSNGLLRIRPVYRGDACIFDLAAWTGSKWSQVTHQVQIIDGSVFNPLVATIVDARVVDNLPERSTVEIVLEAGAKSNRVSIMLSLRRGAVMADMYLEASMPLPFGFRHVAPNPAMGNNTDQGMVSISPDADGVRVLMSNVGLTRSTTTAAYFASQPITSIDAGIGLVPASIAGPYDDLSAQWLAGTSETIRAIR